MGARPGAGPSLYLYAPRAFHTTPGGRKIPRRIAGNSPGQSLRNERLASGPFVGHKPESVAVVDLDRFEDVADQVFVLREIRVALPFAFHEC